MKNRLYKITVIFAIIILLSNGIPPDAHFM